MPCQASFEMAKNAKGTQATRKAAKGTTNDGSDDASKSKNRPSIPAPYARAPAALTPFLSTLDPTHIYITHIDRHPRALKTRIFAVPVLMNILFAASLVWRARIILPWYFKLALAIGGQANELRVDVDKATWGHISTELWTRALVFLLDFAMARFVAPWPYDFFFRPRDNPTLWRARVGFREAEIAVRKSRRWDKNLPSNWIDEEAEGAVYAERIMPAIDRRWVRAKTAYLMLDKNWDLDWRAMVTAHALVDAGDNRLQDFEKTVLVHTEEHGWLAWELWKLDQSDADDEGRQKIVALKEKLGAMGKEALFFRWIEILQFETSQPGGFTPERQAKAMHETRQLFAQHDVNFDQFWADVGGGATLPGMQKS